MAKDKRKEIELVYNLYSFDVFDTLITRTTVKPVGIFAIMQKILNENPEYNNIDDFVCQNFYTIRTETESYVRLNKLKTESRREITLEDIYKHIQNNNNLSHDDIAKIIKLEIETEIKNIKPIQENINLVKKLIKNGNRVVLISDMYHSSTTIRQILIHVDNIFENIPIYVSSEYNKTKYGGDLYLCVKERENILPEAWIHIGDNVKADINSAKKNKIKAKLYKTENLLKYESYALKDQEDNFYIEALSGIARWTRIKHGNNSMAYILGSSFVAPFLYNYVSWIITQAEAKKIKTLHFVARDGFVLKQIADTIIERKKINMQTKYIYGSRIAWRIPDCNNIEEYISMTCREYANKLNLKFLAQRFDIEVDVLKKYLNVNNTEKKLKNKQIEKILIENQDFKNYLISINNTKQDLLVDYLKQNLDLSDSNIAFVDVYGSGKTQNMLTNIINKFYNGNIIGFYFHTDLSSTQNFSTKIAYISSEKYMHYVIELFCRNLDGQTLGYKSIGQTVIPLIEQVDTQKLISWGYNDYLQGLIDFTINASDFEIINNLSLNSYSLYKKYFEYLMKKLDKETADIIGSIPYAVVGIESKTAESAPKYNPINNLKNILLKENTSNGLEFISFARSPFYFNLIKYGSLRKFLIHVYINKSRGVAYIRVLGFEIPIERLLWR